MAKDKTINVWQYSRWTYLIGRSVKFRPFAESEREAIVTFIKEMNTLRPGIAKIIGGKRDNSLDYSADFTFQNDYALGKMLQRLGRDMKAKFPMVGEKALCDALFAATDKRRYQAYKDYVADIVVQEEPAEATLTLAVAVEGTGTVTASPEGPYAVGDVVTITATPAQGYQFTKWSDESTEAVRELTLVAENNLIATFSVIQG